MPSATARTSGKPNVQNTALGSRKKRRRRASVSSASADRRVDTRGTSTSDPRGLVTQASAGHGHEDVLERGMAGRQPLELLPRGAKVIDERRKGDVQRVDREHEPVGD